jgi:predicted GNAT family acetyltransferase
VCTLPEYRGRGLGAALMRAVGARILADGEIPFLHCYPTNASAVALYERLGFSVRAELLHVAWRAK